MNERQWRRSVLAVVAGFVSVAVLSLVTDQLLHVLEVYPPWGEPATGLRPLISPQSPAAGCQHLLASSARLGPLCGSQRVQNSRNEPHSGPMHDPSLNLLALSYRIAYTIFGGYLTASLAPNAPMRHVLVVGIVGLIAGSAGALAALTMVDLGPDWYPIALAITAFPCVWFGGVLYRMRHAQLEHVCE